MSMPDADIYPEATGIAKTTVDKHQEPQELVLYSGWFCPYVQRIWSILEEKGIPYQYVEENPYHKSERLLKLNPRGLVPTLEYKGKALYESTVVAEFLEDVYPNHGTQLRLADPYQRAISRIWSDYVTSRIIPSSYRFLQHQPSQGPIDEKRQDFLGHLKTFTKAMDPEGPFFFGRDPTLVDFIMAPWGFRLFVYDIFKEGGLGIPPEGQAGEDEQTWKRWRAWQHAVENRESIKATCSNTDKYLPIYKRYADDIAQSQVAKAMREGKAVP